MREIGFTAAVFVLACAQLAAADVRVVVLQTRVEKGRKDLGETLTQLVVEGVARSPGVNPVDDTELAAFVDEAARKQLRSCDDDTACIMEIGGATGAEYFLVSSLGTIGKQYSFGLRLLSARTGQAVARASRLFAKDDDALSPLACPLAQELLAAAAKNDKRVSGDPARCAAATPGKVEKVVEVAPPAPTPVRKTKPETLVVRSDPDPAPVAKPPERPSIYAGVRGDLDLGSSRELGGAGGIMFGVGRTFGGTATLLANAGRFAGRLEARVALPKGDTRAFATLGLAVVSGAPGLRASAGVEHVFSNLKVFADLAYEAFGQTRGAEFANPLLLGAGAGVIF